MKDRQKRMIRLLLSQKELFHLEDLAQAFSIGKRTVSRDLDSIDQWLTSKGAGLDRKPGQGIRVETLMVSTEELLDALNTPENFIVAPDPLIRKQLILLYLLYHNREIKISEMAAAFFISDTSVWNDLNLIEKDLTRPTLSLIRHKGVGIQMTGEESQIRLEFLKILTELISSKTVIPYLYSLKTDSINSLEMNRLLLILDKLNFPGNRSRVLQALSRTADTLGYQFTMSGEAILYFYLQLSRHRIGEGCLIADDFPCPPEFTGLAGDLLSNLDYSARRVFPAGEISFLGLLMGVLERGTPPELGPLPHPIPRDEAIHGFTEELIDSFGKQDNRMYYLNEQVEAVLALTVSSLVTRLRNGIPLWHGEWGPSEEENDQDPAKREELARLLKNRFAIEAAREELDYLILYFQSLFFRDREIREQKIRCLVCCFEGIGLAAYLQAVLQKETSLLDIVESTAVFKIRQDYLDAKNIELVLSTFPLSGLTTPVIVLSLPLDRGLLVKQITRTVQDIEKREKTAPEPVPERGETFAFDKVMAFIGGFTLRTIPPCEKIEKIISELSREICPDRRKAKRLEKDFREREKRGSLFFEEYGTRVLHCKSAAVSIPTAGLIQFSGTADGRMLFLIAPAPCPEEERKILSVITLSFMEEERFRDALREGSLSDIRRALMDIYKELI
ncbi:MAG: helix-turn-helix domain-containing protein [Spirochaetales bacterium]|nr:helix-turn-helix domain-containing protein [Spirochaetales bacterium]